MFNWQDREYINPRKKVFKNLDTNEILNLELQGDADNISVESETPLTAYNLNQAQQELVDDMSKTYTGTNITGDTVAGYGRINKVYGKTTEEGTEEKSPSNPYTLKCIGDDVNLFDMNNANKLSAYTEGSSNTIKSDANIKSIYIPCEPNTTYTSQKIVSTNNNLSYTTEVPAVGVNFYGRVISTSSSTCTITTGSNAKYLVLVYYDSSKDTISEQKILNSIKIQKGSVATQYSQYGYGTIENISKNGEQQSSNIVVTKPLCSIGDVRDELDYTKRKITRRFGYEVFDGSDDESWIVGGQNRDFYETNLKNVHIGDQASHSTTNILLEKVIANTYQNNSIGYSATALGQGTTFRVRPPDNILNNLTTFKTWLASNPITIIYQLATPIIEDINCSDKIVQYDGQTTIYNRDGTEIEVSLTNNKAINEINKNFKNNEIETITNENGTAIKFPDGTMICMGTSNNGNGSYDTTYHTYTSKWIHPVPFIEPPHVVATVAGGNSLAYTVMTSAAKGSTQTQVKCLGVNGTIQTHDRGANCIAIGRWK